MRFACCKTKATDSHSEFVVSLLTAFPQQQCLRERVSMLLYTYTACLVHLFDWIIIFQPISRTRDSKCMCVTVPRKSGRVVILAYSKNDPEYKLTLWAKCWHFKLFIYWQRAWRCQ